MSQQNDTITLEQLGDHSSLESLWIAVHGHVYDLTKFTSDHPGGVDALGSCAGTDGTEAYEYASHSKANMTKMQQYRIGKLAGNVEQPSLVSHSPLKVESKRIRSAASRLRELKLPRLTGITVLVTAVSLAVAFSYQRIIEHILPKINASQIFSGFSGHNIGFAFWAGVVLASCASCAGFAYLYKLYLGTLDYQNDVFSFPPTIPKKARR